MNGEAVVFTVPNGQDSDVVGNDGFLTQQKDVHFRVWTENVACDASTASSFVPCESW